MHDSALNRINGSHLSSFPHAQVVAMNGGGWRRAKGEGRARYVDVVHVTRV